MTLTITFLKQSFQKRMLAAFQAIKVAKQESKITTEKRIHAIEAEYAEIVSQIGKLSPEELADKLRGIGEKKASHIDGAFDDAQRLYNLTVRVRTIISEEEEHLLEQEKALIKRMDALQEKAKKIALLEQQVKELSLMQHQKHHALTDLLAIATKLSQAVTEAECKAFESLGNLQAATGQAAYTLHSIQKDLENMREDDTKEFPLPSSPTQ